ncbi:MAG: homocysteine S-methyltransferase family protein [Armatimonadota bacterium]
MSPSFGIGRERIPEAVRLSWGFGRPCHSPNDRPARYNEGVVILDGAMGTELQRRGAEVALPLWSAQALLDNPDLVLQIHREYVEAGAEVLTTNTFRTQRRTFEKVGKDRAAARRLTARAVQLAREATANFSLTLPSRGEGESRRVRVAGSIAPLEDCYHPDLSPGEADEEFREFADWLMEAGSDLLLIETMNNLTEMRSAIRAAQGVEAAFWVSVNPSNENAAELLSGEAVGEALNIAYNEGASAFLVNCAAIEVIERALAPLMERAKIPLGCYANNGVLDDVKGWRFDKDVPPSAFAEHAERVGEMGVSIVGGCCGTTPKHICAIAEVLSKRR